MPVKQGNAPGQVIDPLANVPEIVGRHFASVLVIVVGHGVESVRCQTPAPVQVRSIPKLFAQIVIVAFCQCPVEIFVNCTDRPLKHAQFEVNVTQQVAGSSDDAQHDGGAMIQDGAILIVAQPVHPGRHDMAGIAVSPLSGQHDTAKPVVDWNVPSQYQSAFQAPLEQ